MNQTIEEIETEETAQAARINQKHGFSEIVGECHGKNIHYIAECMTGGPGPFRLKTVSYQYFRSEEALLSACAKHKIMLKEIEDTSSSESFKWWPMGRHKAKPSRTNANPVKTEVTEPKEPEELSQEAKDYELNEKQLRFCKEYLLSRNATRAYTIAYPTVKNSNSAGACASYLLKKPQIKAYLEMHGI